MMKSHIHSPYALLALLAFAFAVNAQDQPKPTPINKEHREAVLQNIAKVQAAQLQFFRTREQAQSAIAQAEAQAKSASEELDAVLAKARKADNVAETCNPNIDLTWSCPAAVSPAKAQSEKR